MNKSVKYVAVGMMSFLSLNYLVAADYTSLFQKSYASEKSGDYAGAYNIIKEASMDGANDMVKYSALMREAYLQGMMSKFDAAAKLYGEASEVMKGAIEPLIYQQYHLLVAKKWSELIGSAQMALKIDSKNYLSRTRLAYGYFYMGDYKSSVKEYESVSKMYPLDLDVKSMLGWAYLYAKNNDQAKAIFTEILSIAPSNQSALAGIKSIK